MEIKILNRANEVLQELEGLKIQLSNWERAERISYGFIAITDEEGRIWDQTETRYIDFNLLKESTIINLKGKIDQLSKEFSEL